jgi:hypothetical protein
MRAQCSALTLIRDEKALTPPAPRRREDGGIGVISSPVAPRTATPVRFDNPVGSDLDRGLRTEPYLTFSLGYEHVFAKTTRVR